MSKSIGFHFGLCAHKSYAHNVHAKRACIHALRELFTVYFPSYSLEIWAYITTPVHHHKTIFGWHSQHRIAVEMFEKFLIIMFYVFYSAAERVRKGLRLWWKIKKKLGFECWLHASTRNEFMNKSNVKCSYYCADSCLLRNDCKSMLK